MKRSIIATLIVLFVVGTGGLFASGQEETTEAPFGPHRGPGRWFTTEEYRQPELVTVTGRVGFPSGFPTLSADQTVYNLMVPRYYAYSVDIKEGDTITVEGYLMTSETSPRIAEGDNHLQVTKATIDGEVYELDLAHGPAHMWDDDRHARGRFGHADDDAPRTPRGRMPMGRRR